MKMNEDRASLYFPCPRSGNALKATKLRDGEPTEILLQCVGDYPENWAPEGWAGPIGPTCGLRTLLSVRHPTHPGSEGE